MGSPFDRLRGRGRRRSDTRDTQAVRELLHDLGHEMTTLSYLVEAVRGDVALPDDSSGRLDLLAMEMSRLLDIVNHGLGVPAEAADHGSAALRETAIQFTRLAGLSHEAEIVLLPGPEVTAEVDSVVLWRVLSNLIGNAARAAGPGGQVVLSVYAGEQAVIDVTDNGPGFGGGPSGTASLGLGVVISLLEGCGGSVAVDSPPGGGTTARVQLPRPVAAVGGAASGARGAR